MAAKVSKTTSEGSQAAFGCNVERGTVVVCHTKTYSGEDGWRAVFKMKGSGVRKFGAVRKTISETVVMLMERLYKIVSVQERTFVLSMAKKADMGRSNSTGSQPTPACTSEGSQPTPARKCVQFVHQIYGLFRDGKEMSALFEEERVFFDEVGPAVPALPAVAFVPAMPVVPFFACCACGACRGCCCVCCKL